jgi:hypothetical protein
MRSRIQERQYPALLMHRPALLMHRLALLMHRPALLMHRPALLMHRPALLMHRPAFKNALVFTQNFTLQESLGDNRLQHNRQLLAE